MQSNNTNLLEENKQLKADNQSLKYDRVDLINVNRKNIQKLKKIENVVSDKHPDTPSYGLIKKILRSA